MLKGQASRDRDKVIIVIANITTKRVEVKEVKAHKKPQANKQFLPFRARAPGLARRRVKKNAD